MQVNLEPCQHKRHGGRSTTRGNGLTGKGLQYVLIKMLGMNNVLPRYILQRNEKLDSKNDKIFVQTELTAKADSKGCASCFVQVEHTESWIRQLEQYQSRRPNI